VRLVGHGSLPARCGFLSEIRAVHGETPHVWRTSLQAARPSMPEPKPSERVVRCVEESSKTSPDHARTSFQACCSCNFERAVSEIYTYLHAGNLSWPSCLTVWEMEKDDWFSLFAREN
jgi:hypothetical protein